MIEAYKLQKAIPKAQERAEKLGRSRPQQQRGVLDGPFGPDRHRRCQRLSLLALESPEFSWFRESTSPRRGWTASGSLSRPTGVTAAGMKFMEFIFDKLGEGEVGVTLNDDASVCYLVKVLSRRPADQKAFETAELFGTNSSSPYSQLAQMEQQEVSQRFIEQLSAPTPSSGAKRSRRPPVPRRMSEDRIQGAGNTRQSRLPARGRLSPDPCRLS